MTQIITGSNLGTQNSSINLGDYGAKGSASLGQGNESVYVNAANGNLVLRQSDGFLADLGFGFDLLQTYNSQGMTSSWSFNVQTGLEFHGQINSENSYVIRIGEDGHREHFFWDNKSQCYRPEEGGTARLIFTQNQWTYCQGNNKITYHYNTEGSLTQINDKDGHQLTIHYNQGQLSYITSHSGKQKIEWKFVNGLLSDVTMTSEQQVIHHLHYEYDEHQRLHKVTRDLGQGKTYWVTYDYVGETNLIADIQQSDGTTLHIDYDALNRVTRMIDGEGRRTTYIYEQNKTLITNNLGETWTYCYDNQARLTGVEGPEHYRIRYEYEGKQLSRIIQGNQVWRYGYNEAGDCIIIEEPNGQIKEYAYDNHHNLLYEKIYTQFDGEHHPTYPQTINYVYDAKGHLRFVIARDGTVTENRYDEEGQLISTRCYLRAKFIKNDTFILSENELITWSTQQNPQQISLNEYRYDWRGQLSEEIHYTTINAQGQGIHDKEASLTYTLYDAAGRLIEKSSLTAQGISTTHYLYDELGRLIQATDNQGHTQHIEYDDTHQRIIETQANGLQIIKFYDHSGLLLSLQKLNSTHPLGQIQYDYDKAGRLICETNTEGLSTYYFYDAEGRVHAKISAQGQCTEYHYNEDGLLVQTYDYAERISTQHGNSLPSFREIKPLKNPKKDNITQIIYNNYQQIAYTFNAEGALIGYTYDAEGHVLTKTAYAKRLNEQHLNDEQIHPLIDSEHDRTLFYYYDVDGRLQAEVNAEGYASEYTYDAQGHLIETCRYKSKVMPKTTWVETKPNALKKDIHTYSLYNAQGLKIADIDGERYLIEYRYDEQGLLQERIAYEHRINGQITQDSTLEQLRPTLGNNDHHTTYRYTDLGQLAEEKTQSGLVTTYRYDEMGQLILKQYTDTHTQTLRQQQWRYDALGRVTQALDEKGAALLQRTNLNEEQIEAIWQQHSIHYTYTFEGLLLSKTDALQQTTRYFYNEYQQLTYTINADGAVTETQYNAQDQVDSVRRYSNFLPKKMLATLTIEALKTHLSFIKNDLLDETSTFEYNSLGQLIAQYDGTHGRITSTYNAFGELEASTEQIDASHQQMTSYAYDRRGLLITQTQDVGGINRLIKTDYDAFGWLIKQFGGQTQAISYELNKRGERVYIFNASNNYKKTEFDAFGRVLSESNYSHSRIIKEYAYDDKNNTLTLINSNNVQIITEFNAFGDKIKLIDANQNITTFHYDERGLLTHVDNPENTFKNYEYDNAGQLLWQTDEGGHKIVYTYDAQGHVLTQIKDPDGLNYYTSYQYDAIGRQLQVTENNRIKQFTYDDQGRLVKSCVDPHGLNQVTQFSYDARGLLLRQTEFNPQGKDKITAYQWDALGRRVATIIDPDGLQLTTTYHYDDYDNLIAQTDANQNSTHFIYDVNNRCRYTINARGVVTEHFYDIDGYEIQTITYANRISPLKAYTEEALKKQLVQDNVRDQYQFRNFNAEGQLLAFYDALGHACTYEYDKNGNVIKKTHYSNPVSLDDLKKGNKPHLGEDARISYFAYDKLNRLRFQCGNESYVTETRYDASGQISHTIQYAQRFSLNTNSTYTLEDFQRGINSSQDNKITRYTYDQASRLVLEISPRGVAKSYQYNELDQVISCTRYATLVPQSLSPIELNQLQQSEEDRTQSFIYDKAGREIYRISPEGQIVERQYDAVGNVIAQLTHAQKIKPQHQNLETLIKLLAKDHTARVSTYKYDAAGRMRQETNAALYQTTYDYDNNGNVIQKTEASKVIWTYRYNETNQLIETTSPITKLINAQKLHEARAIITQTTYDSFGNICSEVRDITGIKQTRLYEYDNLNRRIKTTYPNVLINNANAISNTRQEINKTLCEEVRYNAFNEIIASSDKAGNWKHFAYDVNGNLCYSLDTKGNLTQYQYDAFKRVIGKTSYESPIILASNSDYNIATIKEAKRNSQYDRNEWYEYNHDDQLTTTYKNKVYIYNSQQNKYDYLEPKTTKIYNAFGELILTKTRLSATQETQTFMYYNKDGHQTALIDAEGYLTTYTLNNFGETQSTTEYAQRALDWNENSYTLPQTNEKDRTVTFTYNALSQVTQKTLKQVAVSYFDKLQLKTKIIDLTTTYSYDALGHLTETIDAQGNSAYCYYNELGQVVTKIGPQTQDGRAATSYSYDALGNLVETYKWANGALSANRDTYQLNAANNRDIATFAKFDAENLLISETDGMNHTINYSYDANGNIARSFQTLTLIDKRNIIIDKRYIYDSENHLTQTTTFKNDGITRRTEDLQYNSFGEVIAKGINGQFHIHVEYDLLGHVWRSNTQGYYQIYFYDLAHHLTQIVTAANNSNPEDPKALNLDLSLPVFENLLFTDELYTTRVQRQSNIYDALGHLLIQTRISPIKETNKVDVTLTSATQSQTVDRWGNMLTSTNALHYQTNYEYNCFNEVIKQELPETSAMDEHGNIKRIKPVNQYAYNELGKVIALIDANGNRLCKAYDANGNIIAETNAKHATRYKHYNLLNQLDQTINELNNKTTYIYDKENRLVQIITYNRNNEPITRQKNNYDEAGQLIQQENGEGEKTSFIYDTLGNQIRRQNAQGHLTEYDYDDYGHKISEKDNNGKTQTWSYDAHGHLLQHTDLGKHTTIYEYNRNGLLLHEFSTTGKNIEYIYQGDGQLSEYDDKGRGEIVTYTYDAENQLTSKISNRQGTADKNWLCETDYYQYDELGRLSQIRRRNPDDKDPRYPPEDKALLSVNYDYDNVGNIRHTLVSAKYKKHSASTSSDYYTYDENNRMLVNKGQLINGQITITATQGNSLEYDLVGNLSDASKYDNGVLQKYHYEYTTENQIELIQLNNHNLQSKKYDRAGRVTEEYSFDNNNNLSQRGIFLYKNGQLNLQFIYDTNGFANTQINYYYDNVGNIKAMQIANKGGKYQPGGSTISHDYTYQDWDTYLQYEDNVLFEAHNCNSTRGKNTRVYDINGLLDASIDGHLDDNNGSSTITYLNSSIDGMRARRDKNGDTGYLSIAGKTIGDIFVDNDGSTQRLNVYGGFTPSESHGKITSITNQKQEQLIDLFQEHKASDGPEGVIPDSPQDSLGSYTLQAGDTLESIALQIYGDSSLWYLIADANGIADRKTTAGKDGQLHVGQRLNIPPATAGQHYTNSTHKVLDVNKMLGNTSANAKLPAVIQPKPQIKHHSLFAKMVVTIVAVVATMVTAGAIGIALGATGSIFSAGAAVLSGAATTVSATNMVTASLTAGFIGSIASQGVANAFGLQKGIDWTSALITGLTTAATAGVGKAVGGYLKEPITKIDNLKINQNFSISSAALMMEDDALSQGLNMAFGRQHYFDWTELGTATATGGVLGSGRMNKLGDSLNKLDHNTGIINHELKGITTAGTQAIATGNYFNAAEVILERLGSAIGNAVENIGNTLSHWGSDIKGKMGHLFEAAEVSENVAENNNEVDNHINPSKIPEEKKLDKEEISENSPSPKTKKSESENNKINKGRQLGELSMKEETGLEPSQYLLASARVSKGKGDPGGKSYGAYQLSSKKGIVQDFLKNEGKLWAHEFDGFDPTVPGEFENKWKTIAHRDKDTFFNAQHNFMYQTHYKPLINKILINFKLDINKQPKAIQNVIWSTSVQHKKAYNIIKKSIESLKKMDHSSITFHRALINKIYDHRTLHVMQQNQISMEQRKNIITNRYPEERIKALKMLKNELL